MRMNGLILYSFANWPHQSVNINRSHQLRCRSFVYIERLSKKENGTEAIRLQQTFLATRCRYLEYLDRRGIM
jgi:hypothetical protein